MNETPATPADEESAFPSDEVDFGASPEPDPDATAEILPAPEEQFVAGIKQHLKTAATASAFFKYGEARAALQDAIAARQHADQALSPEAAVAALPAVESLEAMLAVVAVFECIEAVRDAAVLHLGDGWQLWQESGERIFALESALADVERLTPVASGWQDGFRSRRGMFYKELCERRPATYGHPLLDPPGLNK